MATEKNVQIKHFNGVDWDSLFPRTKASITIMNDGTTVQAKIAEIVNQLNKKVDKVSGKGLSTEDFTTDLKNKLMNLPSEVYSKAEVDNKISASYTGIVVSPNEPEDAVYWFEEI